MRTFYRIHQLFWFSCACGLVLTVLGLVSAYLWQRLGPQRVDPGALRKQLVAEWTPQVVSDIASNRAGFEKAACLHLANDPTDYVTDALREAIRSSGILGLVEPSIGEKLQRLLRREVETPQNSAAAIEQGVALGVPCVLSGRVLSFEETPQEARLIVELSFAETLHRSVLFTRRYVHSWHPAVLEPAPLGGGVSAWSPGQRLLLWGLVVILWPVVTLRFLRAVVRQGPNAAILGVLAIYAVLNALAAGLLLGFGVATQLQAAVAVAMLVAAAWYDLWIMALAHKLQS